MTVLDTTPVLIGCAQLTQRCDPADSLTSTGMTEKAARAALADTGAGEAVLRALDTVAVVGFTVDAPTFPGKGLPKVTNPPRALTKRLGISPAREVYTHMGGNTPQYLVNRLSEDIAEGRSSAALIAGAEFLNAYMKLLGMGADMTAWAEDTGTPEEVWGDARDGVSAVENAHGLSYPANTYPLFEQAIRTHKARTVEEHLKAMGRLFAPFTEVAAANPHAWFPTARTAEEIATPSDKNRWVGFPYTKYMNAIIQVDQMAALVLTSVGKARELGVPEDKWVYLHGCADANDLWHVSERINLHSSPAIAGMGRKAFAMADWSVGDLSYIDLYSCFPSAVQIGCTELGIAEDDPRGLTVTGGLPYFGGPGNNYVMHSIATMMEKLRAKPSTKGLVTANGWFVTKHSIGLYSTAPVEGQWRREDPRILQTEIESMDHPQVTETPSGPATIESYTVIHAREGLRMGIVLGRDGAGRRFVANTPSDKAVLQNLMETDSMGRKGTVTTEGGKAIFTPEGLEPYAPKSAQ